MPARASFATGRYIHDIGYWDNSIAYDGRVPSWGHRMQQAGVRVESIGKLHYRSGDDPAGFDRQHIPMHITGGVGMIQLSIRKQFPDFVAPPRRRAAIAESAGPGESEYTQYDRKVADVAVNWLQAVANSDKPWVLFVSFVTPHYPLVAPKEASASPPRPTSRPRRWRRRSCSMTRIRPTRRASNMSARWYGGWSRSRRRATRRPTSPCAPRSRFPIASSR